MNKNVNITNKKAKFEYKLLQKFNAGIVLRFCSVIGDGYDETQCKIIIFS